MESGVAGIATISAIYRAKDTQQIIQQLRQIIDKSIIGQNV
jgi:thiamine monophosphate synthase